MSDNSTTGSSTTEQRPSVERRRAFLPQPDFTSYIKANAYPGSSFFFVGHSYDVAIADQDNDKLEHRSKAIGALFSNGTLWVPVEKALANPQFSEILTRFEHDLLTRLPASALVGPAIDEPGNVIGHSFTVWREERRKARAN